MTNKKEIIYQIETNIDDMNPQIYGSIMDLLFKKGALDVYWTPIQSKNNRPGILITVLCNKNKLGKMIEILFKETTTFGIRYWPTERIVLKRKFRKVKTSYGTIKVKIGTYNGKVYTESPEFKDCEKIARKKRIPVKKVLNDKL